MTDLNIVRAYTEATVKLLLGHKKVRPTLAFTAGNILSIESRISLASTAIQSDTDLIHLAFTTDVSGKTVMADITIFCPRDGACYIHTGGRLAQARGAKRAVILPPDNIRGHFEVTPDEIIQRTNKGRDLIDGGVERAEARLHRVMSMRPDVTSQVKMFEVTAGA